MLGVHSKVVCWQICALLVVGIRASAAPSNGQPANTENLRKATQSTEKNDGQTQPSLTTEDHTQEAAIGVSTVDPGWIAFIAGYQQFLKDTELCTEIFMRSTSILPWLGLCLNTLSVMVFVSKGRHVNTVYILLTALSISDTIGMGIYYDVSVKNWWDWNVSSHTDAGCKVLRYITVVARDCSSFFVLLFTIDRFLFVKFPLKVTMLVTVQRVCLAIAVSIAVSLCLESFNLKYLEINYVLGEPRCQVAQFDADDHAFYKLILHHGIGFLLPAGLVAVFNVLIVRQLRLSSRRRRAMTNAKSSEKSSTDKNNRSLTFQLITVSTFSVLVSVPNVGSAIHRYLLPDTHLTWHQLTMSNNLAYVTDALALLNYTCNFFLYCLTGSKFREDLKLLFIKVVKGEEQWSLLCCPLQGVKPSTSILRTCLSLLCCFYVELSL